MARDLAEILGGAQQSISSSETTKKAVVEDARRQLSQLKFAIIAGEETTGDSLQDGVVSLYGEHLLEEPQVLERYQKVASHLSEASLLDPVVVINRWVDGTRKGMPNIRWYIPYPAQGIGVGLLMGHEIVFEHGASAALPTSIHINRREYLEPHTESAVERGNMAVDSPMHNFWQGYKLGYDLDDPRSLDPDNQFEILGEDAYIPLEILAGRTKIAEWLADTDFSLGGEKVAEFKTMRHLSHKLGIKPIEPATHEQQKALEQQLRN